MWNLVPINIFINYLLLTGYYSSSQYGIRVLHGMYIITFDSYTTNNSKL